MHGIGLKIGDNKGTRAREKAKARVVEVRSQMPGKVAAVKARWKTRSRATMVTTAASSQGAATATQETPTTRNHKARGKAKEEQTAQLSTRVVVQLQVRSRGVQVVWPRGAPT